MGIFENENYKVISDFIESKSHILSENREFNRVYILLSKKIEELSKLLKEEDKEKFNEILELFHKMEDYYYVFSYSLGVKYGEELKKL
ncbi:MAG: hypothetical protein BHW01_00265 [Clostridium sp. 27_14]|mgnify:FL=1|nr:MAG: hypothetical protein BHW01_00265 [Clostridium sp. 27_14]